MSASPMVRAVTTGQNIPTRRIVINNENDMPDNYSTTPGGTIFGTTPGGTKIVYERAFLMRMKDCQLAKTPPTNLPVIPGVTNVDRSSAQKENNGVNNNEKEAEKDNNEADDQFAMDI